MHTSNYGGGYEIRNLSNCYSLHFAGKNLEKHFSVIVMHAVEDMLKRWALFAISCLLMSVYEAYEYILSKKQYI